MVQPGFDKKAVPVNQIQEPWQSAAQFYSKQVTATNLQPTLPAEQVQTEGEPALPEPQPKPPLAKPPAGLAAVPATRAGKEEIREVDGVLYRVSEPVSMVATAYDACVICTGKTDGITFTGTTARPFYTLAVDPEVIPLGTLVVIEGFSGVFRAEDTGSAIKGNRIDIFFPNHQEALEFGVQSVQLQRLIPSK